MGLQKRIQETYEHHMRIARDVLVTYGYVEVCEAHQQYSGGGCDLLVDADEPGSELPAIIADMRAAGFSGDDDEAAEAIRGAMDDTGMGCVPCAKIAAE